ncbi:MAG: phenylalanine--tRNA ligase subunit beta [Candidatus Omnitrophica bacterium]|nr:phenylalanine--tRNA ligase subunit beta [Candidatus Omnitrophota bacterium]
MKVTYNWLKDFVDISITPEALADKLVMAGLEVGGIEEHLGDFIFEIEITSNRPDWLSVIGIAREVAASTGKKLKKTGFIRSTQYTDNGKKNILRTALIVENKKDCPLYTAQIISGVKIGPSPDWLKNRLEAVGCRSINNVVDITNYIMFEYGAPLHAFDLGLLNSDTIVVRRAKPGEKIETIDAKERLLDQDILVIADREKAVALAGVMGGKGTEVNDATRAVLLEAAVFNPVVIRRGRQKQGIQTESSYRFEREVTPEVVKQASARAVELMQELAGGELISSAASGISPVKKRELIVSPVRVRDLLGAPIGKSKIQKILRQLGFGVKPAAKGNLKIGIPFYRRDVSQEADIVEEVARIFGYQNIPATSPKVSPYVSGSGSRELCGLVRDVLVGVGLHEAFTYSLIDRKSLSCVGAGESDSLIEIANPLSRDQEVMVSTLLPGMLRAVALNLNQKQENIGIFEINRVFCWQRGEPREELTLAMALCGVKTCFLGQGAVKDRVSLLHVKGVLETVFDRLGIRTQRLESQVETGSIVVYVDNEKIGTMERAKIEVLGAFDIKNKDVFLAELSLDKLFRHSDLKKRFVLLPLYPGISRDISLVLQAEIKAGDVLQIVRDAAGPLLKDLKVTDYYKGEQIPSGFRGLTLTCFYRSDERTLTEAEVNPLHAHMCVLLTERFGAKIR